MRIGIPKEKGAQENRIALLPRGAEELIKRGHEVFIQKGAGGSAGYSDESYERVGGVIKMDTPRLYADSDLILKVKNPVEEEFELFMVGQALFCFLKPHAKRRLVDFLLQKEICALAFEKVRLPGGYRPILASMSTIAGHQAVLQGMQFLWSHTGGIGKSIVAYPGLEPPAVVIFGAGQAGASAAKLAALLGADVALFEVDVSRIRELAGNLPANVHLLHTDAVSLEPYIYRADLIINTAPLPPNSSLHLIRREMLKKMRKGAVILDVTANLKGAVESIDRHTTLADPVWEVDGIIHYAVPNIPAAVARTASQALAASVLPYVIELAEQGVSTALRNDESLRRALVSISGRLTCSETGLHQKREWISPLEALDAPGE